METLVVGEDTDVYRGGGEPTAEFLENEDYGIGFFFMDAPTHLTLAGRTFQLAAEKSNRSQVAFGIQLRKDTTDGKVGGVDFKDKWFGGVSDVENCVVKEGSL